MGGCVVLFVAGLLDDVRHLSPIAKLVAQFGAAGIAIASGLRVELIGNDLIGLAVAFVWLVGITNAFNLLDNMDGLAAGLAAIAGGLRGRRRSTRTRRCRRRRARARRVPRLPPLQPRHPARDLHGRLGQPCSRLPRSPRSRWSRLAVPRGDRLDPLLPLLVLLIPILDTTLVTVTRILEGRPVTQGGRDHTSHRLVYYGLSEAKAVALLALIAVALGATAVLYNVLDRPALTAVGVMLTFVLLVQFGAFLAELSEDARAGRPGDTRLRHALTVQPRRLVEVLIDFGLTCVSFLAAYAIVLGGLGGNAQKGTFLAVLPILLGVRYVAFVGLRVYRRAWRYANRSDFGALVVACAVSEIVAFLIVIATRGLGDFPARVFVVDLVLFTSLVVLARLAQRLLPQAGHRETSGRAIVVGADAAGRGAVRSLQAEGVRVVGFVDDDPRLARRRVLGIPVVGSTADIGEAVSRMSADRVVLPSVDDGSVERALASVGLAAEVRVVVARAGGGR